MIDFSVEAATKRVEECEAALDDLKTGGLREEAVEPAIKMQFGNANSAVDHAGRQLGRDPWSVPFTPPKAGYRAEQGERERVGRFDPAKSAAFFRAMEDNLKAMKKQLATLQ